MITNSTSQLLISQALSAKSQISLMFKLNSLQISKLRLRIPESGDISKLIESIDIDRIRKLFDSVIYTIGLLACVPMSMAIVASLIPKGVDELEIELENNPSLIQEPDNYSSYKRLNGVNELKQEIKTVVSLLEGNSLDFDSIDENPEFISNVKKITPVLELFHTCSFQCYKASNAVTKVPWSKRTKIISTHMAKLMASMDPSFADNPPEINNDNFGGCTVGNSDRAFILYHNNQFTITFIGSDTLASLFNDMKIGGSSVDPNLFHDPVNYFRQTSTHCDRKVKVHVGIENMFHTAWGKRHGIYDFILRCCGNNRDNIKDKSFYITGHSLGGALGHLCSLRLRKLTDNVVVVTFGTPNIFWDKCSRIENEIEKNHTVLNIQNSGDWICNLPALCGCSGYGKTITFTLRGSILKWFNKDGRWKWGHAGEVYKQPFQEGQDRNVIFYHELSPLHRTFGCSEGYVRLVLSWTKWVSLTGVTLLVTSNL